MPVLEISRFRLLWLGKKVVAVEMDKALVKYGELRGAALGIQDRLVFHNQSCEKWIEKNSPASIMVIILLAAGQKR